MVNIKKTNKKMTNNIHTKQAVEIAEMGVEIKNIHDIVKEIKCDIKDLKAQIEQEYVSKDEFEPLRKTVYGLLAAVVAIAIPLIVEWIKALQ